MSNSRKIKIIVDRLVFHVQERFSCREEVDGCNGIGKKLSNYHVQQYTYLPRGQLCLYKRVYNQRLCNCVFILIRLLKEFSKILFGG